jgi:hypothetical protein
MGDKQEKQKPTLRIFENFFCPQSLAHLPLPSITQTNLRDKIKKLIFHTSKKNLRKLCKIQKFS